MLFAITCIDKSGASEVRATTRPAHLDYVATVADRVVIAGPQLTDDGEGMVGSLFVMEFDTLADAKAFAAGDPYYLAGLFESVSVRPFKKVFPKEG